MFTDVSAVATVAIILLLAGRRALWTRLRALVTPSPTKPQNAARFKRSAIGRSNLPGRHRHRLPSYRRMHHSSFARTIAVLAGDRSPLGD